MNLYVSWGKRENHSWAASSSLDPFIQSQSQMNIHFQHDHHKRPLNKTLAMTDRQCWDNMLHIVKHFTESEYWTHQIDKNKRTYIFHFSKDLWTLFQVYAVLLNFIFKELWKICIMFFTKIWSSTTVFNIDNNHLFLEQQISISKWFLKIMWHWILE